MENCIKDKTTQEIVNFFIKPSRNMCIYTISWKQNKHTTFIESFYERTKNYNVYVKIKIQFLQILRRK